MNNMSIFDYMYPKYKITKPIRLIELFSGYGSQALALKYLGVNFEHWKTCEWAVKSIQAYKDIHFADDNEDYSYFIPKEDLVEILYKLGISSNYNEPMKKEQIKRLSEDKLRTIYNNIIATNNLVNIQQVKGKDLEITDNDKYDYILTYSFPCQDLSLAGKGKGMSDTSTRSGMLWEVERILSECEELPQILLMENVPQVHSEDNMKDFYKWQLRLEELGYKNYWQDLIATDYGIPQTRNRCFMISILGDYSYSFPKPIPLKLKLKDLLEENVDEKYYLSDKMLNYMQSTSSGGISRKEMFERNFEDGNVRKTAATITTNAGQRASDNFIKVKNATKQGYLEATDGDGVDISSRMQYHRGTVQKEMIQTLDTQGGESKGVVVLGGIGEKKSNGGSQWYQQDRIYDNKISLSLTTTAQPYYHNDLRIRKLTPKECFRLMGVKDEDYEKCAKNQSNASLYHLAGDSIVVNVLMEIFKEILKGE